MKPDILEQLYRKYYKEAYLYVYGLCRNREQAEDIVADAFIKAFLSIEEDSGRFRYWLLIVCRNLWIDSLRKNKQQGDFPEGPIADDKPDPLSQVLKQEQNKALYAGMMQLPQTDRELLILHYFSGCTMEEIGLMRGFKTNAVKTRIFRARQKLKNLLLKGEPDEWIGKK